MHQDFSRLKSIFENAPIGIFLTSHSGKFIDLNNEFVKILGYESKKDVIDSINDLATDLYVNPSKRGEVLDDIKKKEDISVFEVKFRKKNKDLIDVRMSIRSVWNNIAKEFNNIGIIEDITDYKKTQEKRKIAEAKLKQSEEHARILFERNRDGVVVVDTEGKILDCNNSYIQMLGYTKDELLEMTYFDITPEKWHEWESKKLHSIFNSKESTGIYQKEYIRKNGQVFPVEIAVHKNIVSGKDNIWGVVRDISERVKSEKELMRSEEKYRDLYENDLIGRLRTDLNGNILLANRKLSSFAGYSTPKLFIREVKNIGSDAMFVDYDRKKALINLKNKGENKVVAKMRTKDGRELRVSLLSKRTTDENGNFLYFDTSIEDITKEITLYEELKCYKDNLEAMVKERTEEILQLNEELSVSNEKLFSINEELNNKKNKLLETIKELKNAQDKLIQSEKMASIGVLTAGIAHEINNPINFINSGIQGLEVITSDLISAIKEYTAQCQNCSLVGKKEIFDKIDEEYDVPNSVENIPKLFKTVRSGIQRTTEIIKGLRTFSRLDNEKKVEANINELIDSALIILQNKYKHRIEIIKNYSAPYAVNCFPGKIVQVFLNILMNSIQAIENKGRIEINTVANNEEGIYVISISDSGAGMPKSVQQRIFDPFFTTKKIGEGTGIGLSIVHGIIESHNGEILVESKVGIGTVFTIELPI